MSICSQGSPPLSPPLYTPELPPHPMLSPIPPAVTSSPQPPALGRKCVLSGPMPTITKSSEHFIHLFGLQHWIQNFMKATWLGFISDSESFMTPWELWFAS